MMILCRLLDLKISKQKCNQQQPTMRVTPSLLAKGFIGRSVDELKRLSVIGILQLFPFP